MPLLLPHANSRCLGGAHNSDNRQPKNDAKGLSAIRATVRGLSAAATPCASTSIALWLLTRHSALPNHHAAAGDGAVTHSGSHVAGTAAAEADSAADADPEAVRLMTAAKILSSASSTDSDDVSWSQDDSSSLSDSLSASDVLDPPDLSQLSVLDEIHSIDADSLALAVGILRQRQPIDAEEDDVQLSERLRDLLVVLRHRPASTLQDSTATTAHLVHTDGTVPHSWAAAGDGNVAQHAGVTGAVVDNSTDDGFWAGQDEWSDVRSALMNIGINASLDEDDDEDVWELEAGRVKTRRTRLLRSLPRLDSSTAQQLVSFLAELQQHTPALPSTGNQHHGSDSSHNSSSHTAAAAMSAESEEQELWWQQAALAYSLLKQQADKVQSAQASGEPAQQ